MERHADGARETTPLSDLLLARLARFQRFLLELLHT